VGRLTTQRRLVVERSSLQAKMHVKIEAVDVVKTSCLPSMELTFDTVDEVCLAADRDRLKNVAGLSVIGVGRLGPAVEFFHSRVRYSIISGVQVYASAEWDALRSAAERSVISGNGLGDSFGFFPLSRKGDSDEELWTSWLSRAQAAAERAGFGKPIAHGFIGAILELEGNVEEHSERASTGIVGYRREDDEFEFVVADRGVGLLASLRTSIEFRTRCSRCAAWRNHSRATLVREVSTWRGSTSMAASTSRGRVD
jgi:hypothetical protein